jgi:hypothetical protein
LTAAETLEWETVLALSQVAEALAEVAYPGSEFAKLARSSAERAKQIADHALQFGSLNKRLQYIEGDVAFLLRTHDEISRLSREAEFRSMPPFRSLPEYSDLGRLSDNVREVISATSSRGRREYNEAEQLRHLARRLQAVDVSETREAAAAVLSAAARSDEFEGNRAAQEALYHQVWGVVSRVLDHDNYAPEHAADLNALEVEMAGQVYGLRIRSGELVYRRHQEHREMERSFLGRIAAAVRR